jgi:16S rRNA (guanine966-N2)-methyltransferase
MLRITGGIYGGRRVQCPPGEIRPAMDRMRESLFSILGNLDGVRFLDLFAGSGIVGLEAASRGAVYVVAVERDRRKREVTERNLEIAGGIANLTMASVEGFLKNCNEHFDVVYLDPPFRMPGKETLLQRVSNSGCVRQGTIVLLHHPGDELAEVIGRLERYDRRRYGGSILDFFECSAQTGE